MIFFSGTPLTISVQNKLLIFPVTTLSRIVRLTINDLFASKQSTVILMRLKSLADVSEELTAYIIIHFSSPMMETVSSSETFVSSYMTTQNTTIFMH
jgi:siroheme synthase